MSVKLPDTKLIHMLFQLVDQNKKKTGAMLHVNISLSEPLLNNDIPTKQEKWLIIDEYNANIYPLLASAQLIPQSMANYQPSQPSSPRVNTSPPARTQSTPVTEDKPVKQTQRIVTPDKPSQPLEDVSKTSNNQEESELEKAEADFNKYGNRSCSLVRMAPDQHNTFFQCGCNCLQHGARE